MSTSPLPADGRQDDLSGQIQELVESVPTLYRELLGRRVPPNVRLRALQDFMDRFGKPAVRAQLTQTVSTRITPEQLQAVRTRLVEDQHQVQQQIEELRRALLPTPQGGSHVMDSAEAGEPEA